MIESIGQHSYRSVPLLYAIVVGVSIFMFTSYDTISSRIANFQAYHNLLQEINAGPQHPKHEIEFQKFLPVLYNIPFKGDWTKSVRQSKFVNEEDGFFQMRAVYNRSREGVGNPYDLKVVLYDGYYRDSTFFDILIAGDELSFRQKFDSKGEIFYETMFPIIAMSRKAQTFMYSQYQSLYINKIKIKINGGQELTFQVLLSSEYNINVVAQNLSESFETLHQLLFAILLILQNCLIIAGLESIIKQILDKKEAAEKYTFFGFLCATVWDTVLTMYVYALSFENERTFSIFIVPALMASFKIMNMEISALELINQASNNRSLAKFYLTVYGCLLAGCMIAYLSNLRYVFVIGSVLILMPQIIQNYIIGHRLKNQFNNFLLFSLPRYMITVLFDLLPQLYMRAYPGNIFNLEPHYLETFFCLALLGGQIGLIYIQKEHGVRAIVPKFMHFSEFKYFMNDPNDPLIEDNECSICLNKIKQFSDLEADLKDSINKTCKTPCGHTFHVKCLSNWMENKLECPYCRMMLPPIQEYE